MEVNLVRNGASWFRRPGVRSLRVSCLTVSEITRFNDFGGVFGPTGAVDLMRRKIIAEIGLGLVRTVN